MLAYFLGVFLLPFCVCVCLSLIASSSLSSSCLLDIIPSLDINMLKGSTATTNKKSINNSCSNYRKSRLVYGHETTKQWGKITSTRSCGMMVSLTRMVNKINLKQNAIQQMSIYLLLQQMWMVGLVSFAIFLRDYLVF